MFKRLLIDGWHRLRNAVAGLFSGRNGRGLGQLASRPRTRLTLETCEGRVLLSGITREASGFAQATSGTLYVDDSNQTGVANGSLTRPFKTIQAAVNAAPSGTTIKVAQGTYAENVVVPDKSLKILGGFEGGLPSGYSSSQPGDFTSTQPRTSITRITGAPAAPVVFLNDIAAKTIVVDGFYISGGHNGIYCQADYQQFAQVTISRNVIEHNGPAALQASGRFYGGGIYSSNATLMVTGNIIRNNNANRGGGLFVASQTAYTVRGNLIQSNTGYDDHGGGAVLVPLPISASGYAVFTSNVVRGNVASKAFNYGWGGGMLVAGDLNPAATKTVFLSHNTFARNYAPSLGGAIFVDDGAKVRLDHELIHHNSTGLAGGAIYVDGDGGGTGSQLTITNCTVANNSSTQPDGRVVDQQFSRVNLSKIRSFGTTATTFQGRRLQHHGALHEFLGILAGDGQSPRQPAICQRCVNLPSLRSRDHCPGGSDDIHTSPPSRRPLSRALVRLRLHFLPRLHSWDEMLLTSRIGTATSPATIDAAPARNCCGKLASIDHWKPLLFLPEPPKSQNREVT